MDERPAAESKLGKLTASPTNFRALVCLFALIVAVFAFVTIANAFLPGKSIKDYELWHDTGQRMLRGEPIYPLKQTGKFPFMYPPAAAALLAPLSILGQKGVVISLVALTALAWFASIVLAARLASGAWKRQHPLVYFVPNVIVIVYVWSNFHLGQPSLVLLALLLAAFVALQTKRQLLAGVLIALAAGIKAFPFITIIYLLYRRYWIAAASLIVALAFLLIVLPAPFRGFQQASADLRQWTKGMLFKYDDNGVGQRPGRSYSWKNQSIFGLANRTLRHVDADDAYRAHNPFYANIADLSFSAVNRIILTVALLLGVAYLAVMPAAKKGTIETDALEFALLILLILLFTPLAFGYLFAFLLYPFTVFVHRLLERPSPSLLFFGLLAIALLALSLPFQRVAQTYGNTFFATLVLFVGLALELWKEKRTMRLTRASAE